MDKNCIQFRDTAEIPCRNIEFPGFNDPYNFRIPEFKKFMKDNYGQEYYQFDKDYIRENSDQSEGFKLRQQQKFVPKYVNFHNNLDGCLVYHGLGSGKCHGINTPILMHDGSVKMVQNIKVGDLLRGESDSPMKVLSLGRGEDELFTVKTENGDRFVCNSEHILCVKLGVGLNVRILEPTVKQYISFPYHLRKMLKLYRVPVHFKSRPVTSDIQKVVDEYDGGVIPDDIKLNDIRVRASFLKHLEKKGLVFRGNCLDLIYIIKSLGYQTKVESKSKRVSIEIIKENLVSFEVHHLKRDKYYGFTLNGNQRYLLGNFIVTHNTCTSILVGEAYKAFKEQKELIGLDQDKDSRIIVSLPPAVKDQFKEELKGRLVEEDYQGCVSQVLYDKEQIKYLTSGAQIPKKNESGMEGLRSMMKIKNTKGSASQTSMKRKTTNMRARRTRTKSLINSGVDILIQKYWNIITHIGLINGIFNHSNSEELKPLAKQIQRGGNLIIIDEVQNLISESGILYEKLLDAIRLISRNNKVLVLSATPIYDKPFEIGLTLNLLNPRVNFPIKRSEFDSIFMDPKTQEMINKDLFYWMCSGYVSYFSGGNPRSFPFKRVIEMHHRMPDFQYNVYVKTLMKEVKNIKIDDLTQDNDNKNYISKVRQYSNIVFPGDERDNSNKSPSPEKLQSIRDIFDTHQNIENALETISNTYSSKLVEIARMIMDPDNGSHLVFSDLRLYGVDALSVILEKMGAFNINSSNMKSIGPNTEGKIRFSVWSGDIPTKEKENYSRIIRQIFNDPSNFNGSQCKAILGTTSIMEGVSFKNMRNVHIMNPWWNESRIQQVIARAVRFHSHVDSPPGLRFVNVFKHYSVFQNYPRSQYNILSSNKDFVADIRNNKESYDRDIKKLKAVNSRGLLTLTVDQHMGNRSMEKKKQSVEFERILKSSAVDCENNHYANLVRLEEYITPCYKFGGDKNAERDGYNLYYINPSNGMVFIRPDKSSLTDMDFNNLILGVTSFSDRELTFIEAEKTFPQIRNPGKINPEGIVKGVFEYRIKENGIRLSNTSQDPLYYCTDDYIINENIDCNENSGYDPSQNNNKSKNIMKLIDQSINYKLYGNVIFDILYPGSRITPKDKSKFLKEIHESLSKNKKNKKIYEKFENFVMKNSSEKHEEDEKKKVIKKILNKNIDGKYNETYMDGMVFRPDSIEDKSEIEFKVQLPTSGFESLEEFYDIVERCREMYQTLKNFSLYQLKLLEKDL